MLSLSELLRSTLLASWGALLELEQPLQDLSLVVIFFCWSCQPKFRLSTSAHPRASVFLVELLQLLESNALCEVKELWRANAAWGGTWRFDVAQLMPTLLKMSQLLWSYSLIECSACCNIGGEQLQHA